MNNLKAAIAGLGVISPMHIKPLQNMGVAIAAVCDTDLSKAKEVAGQVGAQAYANCERMLEVGGFDVLHICLPHYLHAEVAINALERGYHVLTEKPMATNIADAQKMIAAATRADKYLGVIFQNRYSPGALLIKQTLCDGSLGSPRGGWIHVNWHRGKEYYVNSSWRGRLDKEGGGVLINQSIHSFDMMQYFLGNATSVSASIANRAHPYIEVEDIAEGVIQFGNVPVSFFVNTFHPYDAPATVELVCEHGTATLAGENATIKYKSGQVLKAGADTAAQQKYGMKSYWGVSHIKQIQDFYTCVAQGTPLAICGEAGLATQRLINSIYDAARLGESVAVGKC